MSLSNGRIETEEIVEAMIQSRLTEARSLNAEVSAPQNILHESGIDGVDYPLIEIFKKRVDRLVRSDAREALCVAELAKEVSDLSADPSARALGARTKAMALHVLSRYGEAAELYELAIQLYGETTRDVERARVERAMVDALIYLGRYDEALNIADRARKVFESHQEKLLLGQLESNIGNIYHRLDRNHEALDCYRRAEAIFSECDAGMVPQVLFNTANIHCNLDEFKLAQTLYESAYQKYLLLDDEVGATQTRYSIGYLHFLRGNYHQAMRVLHEVRVESLRLGDEQTAALCILDLSEIYLQLNILDEAANLAKQAHQMFESLGMRYESSRSLTFLGLAQMRQINHQEAEITFDLARQGFSSEGNDVQLGLVTLYLAELRLLQDRSNDAIQLAGESEKIFADQKLRAKSISARIVKARALIKSGLPAKVECERILQLSSRIEAPWLRYQAHELLGDSLLAEGAAIEEIHEQFSLSISCIEQIRCSIRVDEFRSAFFKDKLRVYEKLIKLCLDQQTPEKQAEAFFYLESSKARTLVDLLLNELELMPPTKNGASRQLLLEWQELREKLHWYYSRINQSETGGKNRLINADHRLQAEITQCEGDLAEITRKLQVLDPDFVWLQQTGGITVSELQSFIQPGETVIEYYFDKDRLKIFLVDRQSFSIFEGPIGLDEIAAQVKMLRFHLDKFNYGAQYLTLHEERLLMNANDCLNRLWQALFAPIARHIRGEKLVFIPFGVLHNVPLSALFDGDQYLMDQFEIAQSPSAMVFKLCAERSNRKFERAVILGSADEIAPQITNEIQAISELFPTSRCFTGAEATSQSLADNASNCDILHIASHAVFRQDNPMFSAFKLADGWLNFYDICSLKLPSSLVILSGCSTGASKVTAGDEMTGLARGFLSAGAATLVVSLWAVNDSSTAALMTTFYRKLREGVSTRGALRDAALETKSRHKHPYYWAPFVLMSH